MSTVAHIFYFGKDTRVSEFKKIIKKAREPEFDNFAPDRLKLLKLKNPTCRKLPENQALPEDLIHVIVERPPMPLLYTDGRLWDYQESFKNGRGKTNIPMFCMVSGAECGKSRNSTEIPKILRKMFVSDPELGLRLQEASSTFP
ncbi:3945_t:CDS:2 [Funneliformis caledonium]|uniref:3945_t:CDS:1 n=1 Tax=Funneliformis caledonium TaxID=1117310 RepID=A0A9N8VQ25_9GLOM|nr:3945_t:CDS:2 [Funneliformis caledonium]